MDKSSLLQKHAETSLEEKPEKMEVASEDVRKLMHELSACQNALELQNEELCNTKIELEKSRCRYIDLYDYTPVAYITICDKGMVLEANQSAGEMLGEDRGQLLNSPFSDFISPKDRDLFYENRKLLLKTREPQSYELQLKRKNGTLFHARIEILDRSGECDPPEHYRLVLHDISVRKAELEQLRLAKDRYRAIIMEQKDLICRLDSHGRITFVNDAYCRYFGVDYQDLLGKNFLSGIHESDLTMVRNHLENLTREKPEEFFEHRVLLPSGKSCWLQWHSRVLYDRQGKVFEYQAVGRDITKRNETRAKLHQEAQLRQLFLDALPCVALLLKKGTREIVASNKIAASYGAVPGQQCHDVWRKNENPCSWCRAPALWTSQEAQNNQFWASGIYWDAYWVPVNEDLYLHYIFDITEKQKTKEALETAYDELEQRVVERTLELQKSHAQLLHSEKLAAIGNLSASIAHEFNNPLQSVMTIIKGIEQYASLEEREKELIAIVLDECQRMKNLIGDLKTFVQPTSGKFEQVDIHASLDSLLLISKNAFRAHKVAIVKKYGDNIPHIMAVADQLKQVFLNLFNNGVDACEGGGVITITSEAVDEEIVAVHVEDTGTGISAKNIAKIFEPFFTTKPEKGTGLGLSVSYGIVKKHGGRIEVESEAGKGTKFSVFLPIGSME